MWVFVDGREKNPGTLQSLNETSLSSFWAARLRFEMVFGVCVEVHFVGRPGKLPRKGGVHTYFWLVEVLGERRGAKEEHMVGHCARIGSLFAGCALRLAQGPALGSGFLTT